MRIPQGTAAWMDSRESYSSEVEGEEGEEKGEEEEGAAEGDGPFFASDFGTISGR